MITKTNFAARRKNKKRHHTYIINWKRKWKSIWDNCFRVLLLSQLSFSFFTLNNCFFKSSSYQSSRHNKYENWIMKQTRYRGAPMLHDDENISIWWYEKTKIGWWGKLWFIHLLIMMIVNSFEIHNSLHLDLIYKRMLNEAES